MKTKNNKKNPLLGLALPLPSKGYHLNQKNQLKKGFHYISKGFVSDGENVYFIEEKSDKKNKLNADKLGAKIRKMQSAHKNAKAVIKKNSKTNINEEDYFKKSNFKRENKGVDLGRVHIGKIGSVDGLIKTATGECGLYADVDIPLSKIVRRRANGEYYLIPSAIKSGKYNLFYLVAKRLDKKGNIKVLFVAPLKKTAKDYFI